MLLFLAIFWCNIPQMSVPQNQQVYTSCEIPNPTAPRMSRTDIVDRMDNMQKTINRIDNQYLQNIDTMVNKMNTWTGYWLTLLTFILMIVSIWQFINVTMSLMDIERYIQEKKQEGKTQIGEEINLDIVKLLPIILINVRGALYQAKAYSGNILDNIIFDNLQDRLSVLEYNIRHNSVISNADKHSLHRITITISELKESL